jgi:hypothetical protein
VPKKQVQSNLPDERMDVERDKLERVLDVALYHSRENKKLD